MLRVGVALKRERVAVPVGVRDRVLVAVVVWEPEAVRVVDAVVVAVRVNEAVLVDEADAPLDRVVVPVGELLGVAVAETSGTHAVSVTAPAVPAAPEATDEASGANEPATKVTPALAFTHDDPPPPPA